MRYCFDLDGTLCETDGMHYDQAQPIPGRIFLVNQLYHMGHHIIIETARGSGTGEDWYERTLQQLKDWGVLFHELRTGQKIFADFYIDDRGHNAHRWFKEQMYGGV